MPIEQTQQPGGASEQTVLGRVGEGREVTRLRILFLAPLAITIVAIVAALSLALYEHEHRTVDRGVMRIRASARDFYEDSVRYDASALQAVMDTLQHIPALHEALANRDRKVLLAQTSGLFHELNKDYAITHLYFSGTDRLNLLRAHAPSRHGDVIERTTTLSAQRNGTSAFGVEIGAPGTFTLRLVTPWYDDDTRELIGYVELGMEIDRVLQKLRDFFGVEVFVLVHKEFLNRAQWEQGMRTLGRTPDWERFPTVVVGSQSTQQVPPLLAQRLARGETGDADAIFEAVYAGSSYRIAFLPLQDAAGRDAAHMVLIANVSQETDAALDTVFVGSLTAMTTGILLLGFFYWQIGRIGRRIEGDAQALEQLATHDGLTGLYNHRTFYSFLEDEIARARRYRHDVSLLMIDVDYFKRVNDAHGHLAGDAILRGLGERLMDQARSIDRVCRYGGEEIAVILPSTASPFDLAERLRLCVEAAPFDAGTDQSVQITVSIGVASCPSDADTVATLVAVADAALYAAKAGGRNRVCRYEGPAQTECL